MKTKKLLTSEVKRPSDKSINNTVSKVIGEKVTEVTLIERGAINFPFKVKTEKGNLFVKVYSKKDWPEPEKPTWVANQLERNKVPHAKQVFYDRTSNLFPCGIEITEYIEGVNADKVIGKGDITYKQFCEDVAEVLHKVHQIEVGGYGSVNNGQGRHETLNGALFTSMDRSFDQLTEHLESAEDLRKKCKETVEDKLRPYQNRFKPTLVHHDVHPSNCRYSNDGELFIIDWDNTMLFPWPMELAIATYWSHKPTIMREAFLKKYGEEDFTRNELDTILEAFHIYQRSLLIHYYLVDKGDKEKFEKVLAKMVDNPNS
ncbi:aminoglycoside phosphotransferase family protein [Patescibacteria group bacterium]